MSLLLLAARLVSSIHTNGGGKYLYARWKFRFLKLSLVPVLALSAFSALAQSSITVAWNASTSPGVTGYRVYQGMASGAYSQVVNAGNATQTAIAGLTNGATYYFAVVAVNGA